MNNILASGAVKNPFEILSPGSPLVTANNPLKPGAVIFLLLGNIFKMAIVAAAIYALWNFLLAGYSFMSAGGDPKNISKAWEKIYQTVLGLVVAAGSVTIAALIGYLIFKDATFLLTPRLITPN